MPWTIDPAHTAITFSAKHLGVAMVRGHFTKFAGNVDIDDPNDPTTGRGRIVIDAASITTGHEQRDGHLRSPDFLDVEKYPDIVFEAKSVTPAADGGHKVTGDLTIRDVTRSITLDYEHSGVATDPYGNVKTGGTLTGIIDRTAWGLRWNVPLGGGGLLVSEKIKLEIDGEIGQVKEPVAAAGGQTGTGASA